MRLIRFFCIGITSFLAGVAQTSHAAGYQEFELSDYLEVHAQTPDCDSTAKELSIHFATASAKTVVRAYCRPSSSGAAIRDVVIGYQSDAPIPSNAVSDDADAGYQSAAACQSDLSNQIDKFRKAMNTTEFVAYCTPTHLMKIYSLASSLVQRHMTRIDMPNVLSWPIFEPQIDSPALLAIEIQTALIQKGVQVSRVDVKTDDLQFAAIIFYYYASQSDYRFGIATAPIYPTMRDCNAGAANVFSIIKKANMDPLVQFCARRKGSHEDITALYTFGAQPVPMDAGPLMEPKLRLIFADAEPEVYKSWSTCQADRPRVEQEQQTMTKLQVIGSTCSLSDDSPPVGQPMIFRTMVFFK